MVAPALIGWTISVAGIPKTKKVYIKTGIKLNYPNLANSNNPFFKRGGNYNNGSNAGVFNSNNNNGNDNNNNGFRSVLVQYTSIHKEALRLLSQMGSSLRRMPRGRSKRYNIAGFVSKKFNSFGIGSF